MRRIDQLLQFDEANPSPANAPSLIWRNDECIAFKYGKKYLVSMSVNTTSSFMRDLARGLAAEQPLRIRLYETSGARHKFSVYEKQGEVRFDVDGERIACGCANAIYVMAQASPNAHRFDDFIGNASGEGCGTYRFVSDEIDRREIVSVEFGDIAATLRVFGERVYAHNLFETLNAQADAVRNGARHTFNGQPSVYRHVDRDAFLHWVEHVVKPRWRDYGIESRPRAQENKLYDQHGGVLWVGEQGEISMRSPVSMKLDDDALERLRTLINKETGATTIKGTRVNTSLSECREYVTVRARNGEVRISTPAGTTRTVGKKAFEAFVRAPLPTAHQRTHIREHQQVNEWAIRTPSGDEHISFQQTEQLPDSKQQSFDVFIKNSSDAPSTLSARQMKRLINDLRSTPPSHDSARSEALTNLEISLSKHERDSLSNWFETIA